MAKKQNKNSNQQGKPKLNQPSNPLPKASGAPHVLASQELVKDAQKAADSEGVVVSEANDDVPAVSIAELQKAAKQYNDAALSAKSRENAVIKRESELEGRELELKEEKARQIEEKRSIGEDKKSNGVERAELARMQKGQEAREKELLDREIEAERRATELTAEIYKRAHDEVLAPLIAARSDIIEDARKKLSETMSSLTSQAAELDERCIKIEVRERQLVLQFANLEEERSEWEREKESSEADALVEVRRLVERERRKSTRLEQELERLRDVDALSAELKNVIGSNPAEFLVEVGQLRNRVRELEDELSRRPLESLGEQLALVAASNHQLSSELLIIRSDNEHLKTELSSTQTLALERDRLMRENDALGAATAAYQMRVDELTSKFNNLVKQSSDKPPFPECTAMDTRHELQTTPNNFSLGALDLNQIVEYLQQSLASRSADLGPALYFYLDDLRIFLGGMAMSRLHILEGVSGTGKTSMPIAVAQALGGGYAKIEVQAGWRDNRDLLGYYNEFEKHFREHEFTRSLYEALTPRYVDGLYFVILDEMNLSKPEQYFADFLSLLEDREGADRSSTPRVMLNDQSVSPLPKFLVEPTRGGVELPMGENVWFIGTANHDETTASFAPKTQSRAHMMELPRIPPDKRDLVWKPGAHKEWGKVVTHKALTGQFDAAVSEYRKDAQIAEEFFKQILQVLEDFDDELSWGSRINRQIGRFVPTVVATGGSVGLAVDHLLYTKLTRRLRDSLSVDMRNARKVLLQNIKENWPCGTFDVSRSNAVQDLERQISRS